MIETVTDVGPDVIQPSDMTVIPAIFETVDGEKYPGVLLQLDGTTNGTAEQTTVKLACSVEQWIELQLRGEEAAHGALMIQQLLT